MRFMSGTVVILLSTQLAWGLETIPRYAQAAPASPKQEVKGNTNNLSLEILKIVEQDVEDPHAGLKPPGAATIKSIEVIFRAKRNLTEAAPGTIYIDYFDQDGQIPGSRNTIVDVDMDEVRSVTFEMPGKARKYMVRVAQER
jgi:hypothetical protein